MWCLAPYTVALSSYIAITGILHLLELEVGGCDNRAAVFYTQIPS